MSSSSSTAVLVYEIWKYHWSGGAFIGQTIPYDVEDVVSDEIEEMNVSESN